MQTIVALDTRFERTPDGAIWSRGWLDHTFWQRYLDVFDAVRVLARVKDVAAPPIGARRADGPSATFDALPHYIGPWQYAARYFELRRAVRDALRGEGAVILRAPGAISSLVETALRRDCRPFGVEVVGDPLDVFSTGGVATIAGPFLRWQIPRLLRRQCATACAVAYVTEQTLQRRYPPAPNAFTTSYSTIDLTDAAFVESARPPRDATWPFRLLLVGSLEQLYKGPDVLIRAVKSCADQGINAHLRIVGDGRCRPDLEALAADVGVGDRVEFAGRLPPGEAIRGELDRADLFVLPSRTEGLPRVLLEAMARATPCIATRVGGIPELLSPEEMIVPGDVQSLASRIVELAADRARLARLSADNLSRARRYHADELRPRRRAFYEYVAECARMAARQD